jgi:hypothetical protein
MPWTASQNPATQRKWRDRVADFEASGLSLSAFCDRAGVGRESLRRWQRWHARHPLQLPALVEVRRSPNRSSEPDSEMVIELASGRRLRLRPGFDEVAVARLVAVLESA